MLVTSDELNEQDHLSSFFWGVLPRLLHICMYVYVVVLATMISFRLVTTNTRHRNAPPAHTTWWKRDQKRAVPWPSPHVIDKSAGLVTKEIKRQPPQPFSVHVWTGWIMDALLFQLEISLLNRRVKRRECKLPRCCLETKKDRKKKSG